MPFLEGDYCFTGAVAEDAVYAEIGAVRVQRSLRRADERTPVHQVQEIVRRHRLKWVRHTRCPTIAAVQVPARVQTEHLSVVDDRAGFIGDFAVAAEAQRWTVVRGLDGPAEGDQAVQLRLREAPFLEPVQADGDSTGVVPNLRRRKLLDRTARLHRTVFCDEKMVADILPAATTSVHRVRVPGADDGDVIVLWIVAG